jgi:hypothetical protein
MPGLLDLSEVNRALDLLFGSGSPASHDVGILKTEPANDGTGYTEVSGGSYARITFTNNATNWPAAVLGIKKNGTAITFPTSTADWGLLMYGLGFFASGSIKAWARFGTPQSILNDQILVVPVNGILITAR